MTALSAGKSRDFLQIDELEEAEVREWRENIDFDSVLAEELDGADAVGVEEVMDVACEVVAYGRGGDGDARGPLLDEVFDVREAVIAGAFEVFGELVGGEVGWGQSFGANGPDGGDPPPPSPGSGRAPQRPSAPWRTGSPRVSPPR